MMEQPLVLLASARKESNTQAFLQTILRPLDYKLIDLLDTCIAPYAYNQQYSSNDEFPFIVHEILQHQVLVLATPVYWYAMSGLLKTFFDRLTDLVTIDKESGRKLAGKRMFLVAIGTDAELPPGFEIPFSLTAGYFDMQYGGSLYYSQKHPLQTDELAQRIKLFKNRLLDS